MVGGLHRYRTGVERRLMRPAYTQISSSTQPRYVRVILGPPGLPGPPGPSGIIDNRLDVLPMRNLGPAITLARFAPGFSPAPAEYVQVASEPDHEIKTQDADGNWYEIFDSPVDARQAGVRCDHDG